MSQSRARKAVSFGCETGSKARTSVVKSSGDLAPCPPCQNQTKHHQSSRNKHNLPKSIRYDLESALIGLCDVWFEDIKPHLVRNKIKLHVDANGAPVSGEFRRPPAAPGCSHLDPGAASDQFQQTSVNFAACCSAPLTASRAQYRRPLPVQDRRPSSPPTLPDKIFQDKQSKSNSPRRPQSHSNRPQSPTSNRQVHRLCKTASHHSSRPPSHMRKIQTAHPVIRPREESCLLHLVPRCRMKTRNKYIQTEVLDTIKSHNTQSSYKRVNTETTSYNINSDPPARYKHVINLMNLEKTPSNNLADPAHPRNADKNSYVGANLMPFPRYTNPVRQRNTDLICKIPREGQKNAMDGDIGPIKTTQQQCPQNWKMQGHNSHKTQFSARVSRHRNRDPRPKINSAPRQRTQVRRAVDPSIALPPQEKIGPSLIPSLPPRDPRPVMQPNAHFWRCFATTNLNPTNKKQRRQRNQTKSIEPSYINKEIDIINSINYKRIRVLYKSPSRESFPSVMNLACSSGDREN